MNYKITFIIKLKKIINDLNNKNNKFNEETIIFIEDEFEKFCIEATVNSKNMIEIKKQKIVQL